MVNDAFIQLENGGTLVMGTMTMCVLAIPVCTSSATQGHERANGGLTLAVMDAGGGGCSGHAHRVSLSR